MNGLDLIWRKFVLFFLFLITGTSVFCQDITISGKVIDHETQQPIGDVIVKVVRLTESQILSYTRSDKDGTFTFKRNADVKDLNLEFSHLGYASQTQEIKTGGSPFVVELAKKNIQLKEVVVVSPKRRPQGDTIKYEVSAFAAKSDRTIGDVLKKIPGIEVSESGEIKYQGQKLNKFYVEGSDLLGNRYGLATNNISHKDVASVEVMEDHQPVKMLEGIVFSTQPALNIKLKEDAKLRWVGTLKAGGGVDDLWNAEVFAMRFAKNMQSLNTYKGNNIGGAIDDAHQFSMDGDGFPTLYNDLPSYIQVSPSSASQIGSNRSRFENVNTFTTNNLFKIGKDYELLPQIIFSDKQRSSDYASSKTYYLANNQAIVQEYGEDARASDKTLNSTIELKTNQKKLYVDNTLKLNLAWNNTDVDAYGTYPNMQRAGIKNTQVSNDLNVMKRQGNKVITFQTFNEAETKPQQFTLTQTGQNPINQNIDLSSFYSRTSLQYGFVLGRLYFNNPLTLTYRARKIENTLQDTANATSSKSLKLTFGPTFEYGSGNYDLVLKLPLLYQHLSAINESKSFLYSNPGLNFNYFLSSKTNLFVSGSYATVMPDENLFYQGIMLTNYQSKNKGYINFATGNAVNVSSGIKYKDILNLFFADAAVNFSNTEQSKTTDQTFIDSFILNSYIPGYMGSKKFSLNTSVSKSLSWINGIIALYPTATIGETTLLRNGTKIPYNTNSYNLKGRINSKTFTWCNLTYDFMYRVSSQKIPDGIKSSQNQFSETFAADFYFLKSLQSKLVFEHYYNQISDVQHKNFVFPDISLSYLHKRWEFSLQVRNIFDERSYSYIVESNLTTAMYNYKIRPRDILSNITYQF